MKIREHKPKNLGLRKINPLIKILILSDMLIVGASGMFAPFYALYVEEFLPQASVVVIGISMSIYLVSRSILQIPIATIVDKIKGEKDDYYFMVLFSILSGALYFSFLYITQIWQLYLVQVLLGLFTAITYPSYMAIFTRHIDPHMEGTEWGVYYTFVDLSSAAFAAIAGYIADSWGYANLIVVVSLLCILGALILIPIKPYIYKK